MGKLQNEPLTFEPTYANIEKGKEDTIFISTHLLNIHSKSENSPIALLIIISLANKAKRCLPVLLMYKNIIMPVKNGMKLKNIKKINIIY